MVKTPTPVKNGAAPISRLLTASVFCIFTLPILRFPFLYSGTNSIPCTGTRRTSADKRCENSCKKVPGKKIKERAENENFWLFESL